MNAYAELEKIFKEKQKQSTDAQHHLNRRVSIYAELALMEKRHVELAAELIQIDAQLSQFSKALGIVFAPSATLVAPVITSTQVPKIPGLSEAIRKVGIRESTKKKARPGLSAAILKAVAVKAKPWKEIYAEFQADANENDRTKQGVRTTCIDLEKKGLLQREMAGKIICYIGTNNAVILQATPEPLATPELPAIAAKYAPELQLILRFFFDHPGIPYTASEVAAALRHKGFSSRVISTGVWDLGNRKAQLNVDKTTSKKKEDWFYYS